MLVSSDGMGFFEYVRRQHEAMMAEKAAKARRMPTDGAVPADSDR
jgi:hypothetical protein